MRKDNPLLRLLAALFAFSLVAAACGGSDDAADDADDSAAEEEAGAGAISEEDADSAVADAAENERVATSTATTIEELEAEWAAKRQETIDMLTAGIESGEYGIGDDNILRGTGGFEIDLNNCPADWSNTEGIDDTILLGLTTALSGNLAAFGNMAAGWDSLIQYVNETHGGIGGLPMELLVKDDGYVATQTIELVDELLQSDKPFTITTLGSPNTFATYGTLNDNCVPQPFVQTGHPAWGDPVNHPWTTGLQMSYSTEAILWGAWIKQNMADQLPVTVAALVMENDFGLSYEGAMETYAEENPDVIAEFIPVRHEPAAPTVTNEMTTIMAANPDIFLAMTSGNACLLAVEESGRNGMSETGIPRFVSSTCKDPNAYMIPAGEAADQFRIVGGGQKINTDPQYADDIYVQWANGVMEDAGLDTTIGLYFTGLVFGWPHVEALRIANELPEGLTRTNFMLAMRALDLNHGGFVDGINFKVNGNEDAYYIEGSDFSIYDAENQSWIEEGGVVNLDGSSPNCAWSSGSC